MNKLIRIKLIIDHITKEPYYPKTHAIGVGYTDKNGDCITVLEALDNLKNTFEVLSNYYLQLGHGENQAFPGNEGAELQELINSLTVDDFLSTVSENPVQNKIITTELNLLSNDIVNKANISDVYTKSEIDTNFATKDSLEQKLDTLASGANIKTINNENILIDANTSPDKYNFSLAESDDINVTEYDNSIDEDIILASYKALKLGQEQMLVLKSMGSELDALELPSTLALYDMNEDGNINYEEVSMIYGFMFDSEIVEIDNVSYKLLYYTAEDGTRYMRRRINAPNNLYVLYKWNDNEWVESEKNPNPWIYGDGTVPGLNGTDTPLDVTALYNMIINIALANNIVPNDGEFEGEDVLFAIYDPTTKKIKIGYDYELYLYNNKSNDYIITTFTPSPNVIYCNTFNNKLYRWRTASPRTMIELNSDTSYILTLVTNNVNLMQQSMNLVLYNVGLVLQQVDLLPANIGARLEAIEESIHLTPSTP